MKSFAFALALCAISVCASPFPQAVTTAIPPPGGISAGCSNGYDGEFGIAVVSMSAAPEPSITSRHESSKSKDRATTQKGSLTQIPDGQLQNPHTRSDPPETPYVTVLTEKSTIVETNHLSSIHDGQLQGPTAHEKTKTLTHTHLTTLTEKSDKSKRAFGYNRIDKQTASSDGSHDKHDAGQPAMQTCSNNSTLTLTLNNNVLTDDRGRTGYIASNYQFQFDGPPQAGAMYTSGFSVCPGDLLALGPSTTWWQCLSGDFYNLYDRNWAPQCEPIQLQVVNLEQC